jgi:ribose transport system permease protein
LYVGIALVAIFSVWVPQTFLTKATIQSLLNFNAITGLIALGLVIPLACGVFDLSIGFTMGLAATIAGVLVANHGFSAIEALAVTVLLGLAIGALNGAVVVLLKIDSFIGTLGVGSILQALILSVAGNETIIGAIPSILSPVANANLFGISTPVWVVVGATIGLWYLLEWTAIGRKFYAVGFNREAARLARIPTERLRFGAFLVSASFAAIAGALVTARLGSVDPTVGPSYLLPAYAAVFLGTTQHYLRRFNAVGTITAVTVLALANEGLALTTVPIWVPSLFDGAALILALAIARLTGRSRKQAGST